MLYEFPNITHLYRIHLCPEEIFYSYVNRTAIDTRRQFVGDGCAVWLGFCTVRYMPKTSVHFPHYRGTTSVTCETGIEFHKGVLRMRIVICRPAHIPSAPTRGAYTIQLSLLQAVNINCSEKFYFDPKFIICPNV